MEDLQSELKELDNKIARLKEPLLTKPMLFFFALTFGDFFYNIYIILSGRVFDINEGLFFGFFPIFCTVYYFKMKKQRRDDLAKTLIKRNTLIGLDQMNSYKT